MLVAVFSQLSAVAEQPTIKNPPLTIVAPYLPALLHPGQPGPYNDLMDDFLLPFGTDIQVSFAPVRRSLRQFFSGQTDCFFAGNASEVFLRDSPYRGDDLLATAPFNTVNIRAFTTPDMPLVTSLTDLSGRTVAADIGIGGDDRIRELLEGTEKVIWANSALSAHTLVKQRRVYAAIIADYDYILALLRAPGEQMLEHDPSFLLEQFGDTLLCRKTPDTITLVNFVNMRLATLKASGELAEILRPDPDRSLHQFNSHPHPYLRKNP